VPSHQAPASHAVWKSQQMLPACSNPRCPLSLCGLLLLLLQAPAWGNPAHPYTIAANVIWVVLFGWSLAAMHLAAALVQAATIIGIGTAVTNVQLAMFAL
jgi:hypothetical protein